MSTIPAYVDISINIELRNGTAKGLNDPPDAAHFIALGLVFRDTQAGVDLRALNCQYLSYAKFVGAVSEFFKIPVDEDAVEFGYVHQAPVPNARPYYLAIHNDMTFQNAVAVLRNAKKFTPSTFIISSPLFCFTPKPPVALRPGNPFHNYIIRCRPVTQARISPPGLSKPADLGLRASSTEPIDTPQVNNRQPSCSPILGEHLPQPLTASESTAENVPENAPENAPENSIADPQESIP
jgi:hypothetical protein